MRGEASVLPSCPLTPRQLEVLKLAAEGLTMIAIGEKLGISRSTVKNLESDLRARLGVRMTVSAVALAMAGGWIDPRVRRRRTYEWELERLPAKRLKVISNMYVSSILWDEGAVRLLQKQIECRNCGRCCQRPAWVEGEGPCRSRFGGECLNYGHRPEACRLFPLQKISWSGLEIIAVFTGFCSAGAAAIEQLERWQNGNLEEEEGSKER